MSEQGLKSIETTVQNMHPWKSRIIADRVIAAVIPGARFGGLKRRD
jgi:hypothetical protein